MNSNLFLIKLKKEFSAELQEAIDDGNSLIICDISTFDELNLLSSEYEEWDRKNCELLKNSFNIESNAYLEKYNYTPPHKINHKYTRISKYGVYYRYRPPAKEVIIRLKNRFKVRIRRLKEILNDLPKLKVANENLLSEKSKFKKMIAENRIKETIDTLIEILEPINDENYDATLIQASRFKEVKKSITLGIIDYEKAMIISNRIKVSLLEIINNSNLG